MSTVHVSLSKIQSNPWQPRIHEDEAKVKLLRDSILTNYDVLEAKNRGLYQIPMARVWDAQRGILRGKNSFELLAFVEAGEGIVQLAFGHRRFHAFQLLANGEQGRPPDDRFSKMPLDLMVIGDMDMAELAGRENGERVDLTWFEQAQFINRFINEFKITQASAAEKFGLGTQGNVANYVRAYHALVDFKHSELLHYAEEGLVPLKHVLYLVPLLREQPIKARQWLAANPLINEDDEVRPAAWIKAEVDRLLGREKPTEPSDDPVRTSVSTGAPIPGMPKLNGIEPTDESKRPWDEHYAKVSAEHPDAVTFIQLERVPSLWVAVGETAEKVAQQIGAKTDEMKFRGKSVQALQIRIGEAGKQDDTLITRLEKMIGKSHVYVEPDDELHTVTFRSLHTNDVKEPEPELVVDLGALSAAAGPEPDSDADKDDAVLSADDLASPESEEAREEVEAIAAAREDEQALITMFDYLDEMLGNALDVVNRTPEEMKTERGRQIASYLREMAKPTLRTYQDRVSQLRQREEQLPLLRQAITDAADEPALMAAVSNITPLRVINNVVDAELNELTKFAEKRREELRAA